MARTSIVVAVAFGDREFISHRGKRLVESGSECGWRGTKGELSARIIGKICLFRDRAIVLSAEILR